VEFKQTAEGITLTLPANKQDKTDAVVTLELSAPAANEMEDGQPLAVENGRSAAKEALRQAAVNSQQSPSQPKKPT